MSPPRQNRAASGQGPASPLFSPAAVGGPPRCSAPLHYSGPRGRGPARSSRRGPGHPVPRRPPLAARGARTLSLGGWLRAPLSRPLCRSLAALSRGARKRGEGAPLGPLPIMPYLACARMRPHADAYGPYAFSPARLCLWTPPPLKRWTKLSNARVARSEGRKKSGAPERVPDSFIFSRGRRVRRSRRRAPAWSRSSGHRRGASSRSASRRRTAGSAAADARRRAGRSRAR